MSSAASSASSGQKRARSPTACSDAPTGIPCIRCRRSRATPNPIQCSKYSSDYLPFRSSVCVPCANYTLKVWRGKPISDLDERLADASNLSLWLSGLQSYEADYVAAEARGGRISKATSYQLPFKSVLAVERNEVCFKKDLGVFWPEEIYLKFKGVAPWWGGGGYCVACALSPFGEPRVLDRCRLCALTP